MISDSSYAFCAVSGTLALVHELAGGHARPHARPNIFQMAHGPHTRRHNLWHALHRMVGRIALKPPPLMNVSSFRHEPPIRPGFS